jgi:hypothetical protein
MIFKVDPEPGTDRYMIWSTVTDMPSVIGTRDDMIAWLQPPTGDGDRVQAMRVMSRVDQTGTSDRAGRGGWHDIGPIPVGDIAPDDGCYQVNRRYLPALADAIGCGDTAAARQLFVKYA